MHANSPELCQRAVDELEKINDWQKETNKLNYGRGSGARLREQIEHAKNFAEIT